MYKILVADDERKIRELIVKYVRMEGHEAFEAANGLEAVELCRGNEYDLIVMDVMMQDLDGFSAVKEIRKKKNTPVIMLTARGEDFDKIHAFEAGVDDYVVKPFSPKVLMLRIEAIMRRCQTGSPDTKHEVFRKDSLVIDFTARQVHVGERELKLAPKEYDLLFFLVRNRNIALPREKILTEVWGNDFYGDDRTLDYHIKMLRKALGVSSGSIVTLRGTGYRFDG